jgi:amidohydrolase
LNLLEQAKFIAPDLVEIRRDLHRHPELAFQEVRTAGIAARALENLGCKIRTEIGITGVIADLDNGTGPKVAIRADMDALPIQEINTHDFVSRNPGVMHACGHDAHVAGLIGAARLLSKERDEGRLPSGSVRFIFQPSEESTDAEGKSGAMRMVEEGVMEGITAIIGLHIISILPSGKIFFRAGPLMAGSEEIHIEVLGQSGHAAQPDLGIDALALAAQGIIATQQAVSNDLSPTESGVLTFGKIEGGTAKNVLADRVTIEGTMRFFSEDVRDRLCHCLKKSFNTLKASGAKVDIRIGPGYLPVINNPQVTEWVQAAAIDLVGNDAKMPTEPTMLAEDFSFLGREAPSTFFFLGGSPLEPQMHHRPDFRIDESVIPIAAATLAAGAIRLLKEMT